MEEKVEKNMHCKKMKKTAIVTGGARGIGKAIVEMLIKEGYNVVIGYNKSEENAKKIKEQSTNNGQTVEIFKADLSKKEEAKKLVKFSLEKFKKIDILINNCGIDKFNLFTDIPEEEWNEIITVNLNSTFFMSQEVAKNMIANQEGCIINISSIWGMVGASCEVAYSTSKSAINGMTKALAKELGPSNIRVNSVAPGFIDTDINKDIEENIREIIKNETPLGKIGKPEDIAKCVKWLIEDGFTTGQIISPNGGWVII